jgi:hypothetical protein
MNKAIAAYTPNVAWMTFRTKSQFDMDGKGTSSSTPQVAASCALWLELHGGSYPANWRRVEACRKALFGSARPVDRSVKDYLGRGILRVPEMLNKILAGEIQQAIEVGKMEPLPVDDIDLPLWEPLMGAERLGSEEEKMYMVELAQVIYRSTNPAVVSEGQAFDPGAAQLSTDTLTRLRQAIAGEPDISSALKTRMSFRH